MVALGVFLHALGGFAAGSFYAPCKKVRHWAWETYWLALGIFAWILVPLVVIWLDGGTAILLLATAVIGLGSSLAAG
jgi:L-rhamnose-H+ transport protein